MRPGVSHHHIKEAVWPKLQAAAAVILGHTHYPQNLARRFAGFSLEISTELFFHDERRGLPFLEHLVKKIVFPVLPKFRMKSHVQQTIRPPLAEHLAREIS